MFIFNNPIQVTEYTIESEKLKSGEKAVFAVISDLHECVHGRDNEYLLGALKEMEPEGIIIPGDMIDAYPHGDSGKTMGLLKKLHTLYPRIYYAPGNHERKIFEKIRYTRQMVIFKKGMARAGLSLMRNESADAGKNIRITGLDLHHAFYRRLITRRVPEGMLDLLLGKADTSVFNILIAHDPDHFPDYVKWKPDLILSGHVHGGLIRLPGMGGLISPAYRLFPKYDAGLFEKDGVRMIVSRGAGSHTVNIRINNPPEILKLVIEGKENGSRSKA